MSVELLAASESFAHVAAAARALHAHVVATVLTRTPSWQLALGVFDTPACVAVSELAVSAAPAAGTLSLTQAVSITPPLSWSLDVDGDGQVTALGDGLMVIRKLFDAFPGEALTAKAISHEATRDSTEIHAYIQQGIQQGLLDVDRDGSTTALGDGLMVIRHLFDAFGGDSLINKAISDSSSLIPQGQTLTSLDGNGRLALADQVRAQVSALLPPPGGLS